MQSTAAAPLLPPRRCRPLTIHPTSACGTGSLRSCPHSVAAARLCLSCWTTCSPSPLRSGRAPPVPLSELLALRSACLSAGPPPSSNSSRLLLGSRPCAWRRTCPGEALHLPSPRDLQPRCSLATAPRPLRGGGTAALYCAHRPRPCSSHGPGRHYHWHRAAPAPPPSGLGCFQPKACASAPSVSSR